MNRVDIRVFDSLGSTNTAMAADAATLPHGTVYRAVAQTAGRGQRGNSWEASPGLNLTFSLLLRPRTVSPAEAFAVSMLTSLSIAGVLERHLDREVLIKWPNDIYVGDLKLAGILIENSFSTHIDRSIIGVGINVNQREFRSDAPNPVSMYQLAGREFDLDALQLEVAQAMTDDFDRYEAAPDPGALTARYRSRQWRGSGTHRWRDNLTGEILEAAIASIAPDGTLTLATEPPRSYAFKEISPVL